MSLNGLLLMPVWISPPCFSFMRFIKILRKSVCWKRQILDPCSPFKNKAVSKGANIWNRYNQVPHLTQDTNRKVTNSQLDTTNESQEVGPFQSGDHKAHINRRAQRHSKQKTDKKHKRSTLERSIKYFTGGFKPVSWRQSHP